MRKTFTLLGLILAATLLATIATGLVGMTLQRDQTASGPGQEAEALPVLYELPAFELIDQDGEPWSSEQLRGKLWVADFMFTRCNGICPMQSHNMQALQEALRDTPLWDEVRFVSVSIDAENDTPAVLREYAQRYQADPTRWTFLTGPKDRVWSLSRDQFKLDVTDNPGDAVMPINHSGKFVVVDREGRVRAYHSGTDPSERAALIADLRELAAERSGR